MPQLTPLSERQLQAANAARDLFDLLPPQDFPNPKLVMVAVVERLSHYHQAVIAEAPIAIAARVSRLTLKAVTDICNELQDAVSRKFERDRAAEQHRLAIAAPGKPDDARIAEQVIDYETRIKPLLTEGEGLKKIEAARVERPHDGEHWRRIGADLEARKARNDQQQESTGPPASPA